MCRFLGYLGTEPVALSALLDHHENSLVNQSRRARETQTGLNADGFGVGWYNRGIGPIPGLFKSTQPAWNDENLSSVAKTVSSRCFLGHVRASTVGDVSSANCHPFLFGNLLSAHNGTIASFRQIQRDLCNLLHEEDYLLIRGQTDSEHLAALISTQLRSISTPGLDHYQAAITEALSQVHALQNARGVAPLVRANYMLTDGTELIALKYTSSEQQEAWSLYYSSFEHSSAHAIPRFHSTSKIGTGVVVASEPLTESSEAWNKIPENHFLKIDANLTVSIETL